MNQRRKWWKGVGSPVLLLCAIALSSCSRRPESGTLAWRIDKAKQEGAKTVRFSEISESVDGDLAEMVGAYSIVTASVQKVGAATTVTESVIFTWNTYRDVHILSKFSGDTSRACTLRRPDAIKLGHNEIAIAVGGGTTVMDGVEVRMTTNMYVPTQANQRYLMFVVLCDGDIAALPMLGQGVFVVDDAGDLSTAPGRPTLRFQQQAEELGNVDAVLALAEKLRR